MRQWERRSNQIIWIFKNIFIFVKKPYFFKTNDLIFVFNLTFGRQSLTHVCVHATGISNRTENELLKSPITYGSLLTDI